MTRCWWICLVALAGCESNSAAPATPGSAGSAAPTAKKGSGNGFSATLSAELAKEGVATPGSATAASATPSSGSTTAPAAAGSGAATGSAAAAATKPDTTKPDTTKPDTTKPDTTKPDTTKPQVGSGVGPSGIPTAVPPPTKLGAGSIERPGARKHVAPPADLAAIKMDLEPNWDRDYDEAGTISFVLKVPNTEDTRLFNFHYGYDDPKSPVDCDAYAKWLVENKKFNATLDRQRGGACYVEGTDTSGAPAFRYLVNYGGKHLICYGALYKDAASNPLGDLRDKVVMAAKKICETMAL